MIQFDPSSEGQDDIWASSASQEPDAVAATALTLEIVENVEPLDEQLTILEKKTVPDALRGPLFADPLAVAQDQAKASPPLLTYAILDAAKVPGLPAMLEASGLPHRCLFRDAAYKELKDVAPWLVQLDEASAFCRRLFTSGEAHWQLWDKAPGIFIRSRAPMEELWRHFRKFTRIQDEAGKWFYFRFYDPACIAVSKSLLPAIDRSIQQPLTHPARLIITGPGVTQTLSRGANNGHV